VPAALEDEQLLRHLLVHLEAVQDAAVDDQIVALAIRQIPIGRLEDSAPFADIYQLIALRIPIVVLVFAVRLDVQHRDVGVEQNRNAIECWTTAALDPGRQEMAMLESLVGIGLVARFLEPLYGPHCRRGMHVVHQR